MKHKPPFRVGKKQGRAILDVNGLEVVIFPKGSEGFATDFCEWLNAKYKVVEVPIPITTWNFRGFLDLQPHAQLFENLPEPHPDNAINIAWKVEGKKPINPFEQ